MCQKYYQHCIGEGAAEIGAVDVRTLLFRDVDLLTTRAVDLNPGGPDLLAHSDWQDMLSFAKDARTNPKDSFLVFFFHNGESFRRGNVSGMDKTVYICCLLINGDVSASREKYL